MSFCDFAWFFALPFHPPHSFSHYSPQLIEGEWFGQEWSASLLQETLNISTRRNHGSKYYPVCQLRLFLFQPLIEFSTVHSPCRDVNQAKVILPPLKHILSYLPIGSNIYLKSFVGKHFPTNIGNCWFMVNYKDSLDTGTRVFHFTTLSLSSLAETWLYDKFGSSSEFAFGGYLATTFSNGLVPIPGLTPALPPLSYPPLVPPGCRPVIGPEAYP